MIHVEQKYYDEITKFVKKLVEDVVSETVAKTLLAVEHSKGDAISQRQAEKEFGRGWLHQHMVAGLVHYTQAIPEDFDHNNGKRTFSRAQLCELRRQESTSIEAYQRFVLAFKRAHEGHEAFDELPEGLQEMFLTERRDEAQKRLDELNRRKELNKRKKGDAA